MSTIWFMYDCHVFERVGDLTTPRSDMEARAAKLFKEDGCGHLFARDRNNREPVESLGGHPLPEGGWGVSGQELARFFDSIDEHVNWLARG